MRAASQSRIHAGLERIIHKNEELAGHCTFRQNSFIRRTRVLRRFCVFKYSPLSSASVYCTR